MDTFADRLKEARGAMSQAVFARQLGIPQTTLSNYEKGKNEPSFAFVEKVCSEFRLNVEWLLFGRGPMRHEAEKEPFPAWENPKTLPPSTETDPWKNAKWQEVPVIGLAACGLQGWYNPSPLAMRLTLNIEYPYNPELFAVIAVGTSMQPEGIRQGYVLFCDPGVQVQPEDAVFIELKDGTAAVKTFLSAEAEWVYLRGWLPPAEDGTQKPFNEQLNRSQIKRMVTVVVVRRRA